MEEKKFDFNSVIGLGLIAIIFFWMYQNQPPPEEIESETNKTEQLETQSEVSSTQNRIQETDATPASTLQVEDSLGFERLKNKLGSFAYSATLPSATDEYTVVENDLVELKVSNKGGFITEARLKSFTTYDSIPVYIIKDGNALLNLNLLSENRSLNTKDLYFEPTISKVGDNTVLSMKLKTSEHSFLEYRYELKPGDYMMDFTIRTQDLNGVLNTSDPAELTWELQGYRHAKSISYENRYTELIWEYEGDKDDYLGQGRNDDDSANEVSWIAFKQHFFNSILLTDTPFKNAKFYSENLVQDEEIDTLYTKRFRAEMPLEYSGGELAYNMNWYYGPTDFKILNGYDRNLDETVSLGWGIFGWINRYVFFFLFDFLSSFISSYGLVIILMTVIVKLLLSPVQYKQFLSQAKLKILRPEMEAIKAKHKDNKMKIQQETMALQTKAGASPMSGCLPALMQIPVFYALFMFFPSAFQLRQKGFLWADDLSSYDTIFELPFNIPMYGDHVSLFPILASIAIFVYMMLTTGQSMQMQQQPGMPNMKVLMYLSPLFMLVFFNNYASGLSLYYFISNLITIGIVLVIKNYIIDENKVLAKIEASKKKPAKKKSKFQQKMAQMMEEAEKQKKAGKKR